MSGFALMLGDNANRGVVHSMLSAAHYRGKQHDLLDHQGLSIATQMADHDDDFSSVAVVDVDGSVCVIHGCLFQGDSSLSAELSARKMVETYRSGGIQSCLSVRGAFAVALIDKDHRRLIAMRSSSGERPLFFRVTPGNLLMASEVKQLLEGGYSRPSVDTDKLLQLIAFDQSDQQATSYEGIMRLPAGSFLDYQHGECRVATSSNLQASVGTLDIQAPQAAHQLAFLLGQAISRRMKEPATVLMSGGIDSTSVAAAAQPLHQERFVRPVGLLSATYPGLASADESHYVMQMASALGAQVAFVEPRPNQFAGLELGIWLNDGPDIAPFSSNYLEVLRLARSCGATNLLDGHDGDSVFGLATGLPAQLLTERRVATMVHFVRFVAERNGIALGSALRSHLIPALIDRAPWLRRLRSTRPGTSMDWTWMTEPLPSMIQKAQSKPDWKVAQWRAARNTLPNAIERVERMAQYSGVSVKHPLADIDLVKFLLELPAAVKFHRGWPKAVPRLAFPAIPAEVRWRTDKTTFEEAAIAFSPNRDLVEAVSNSPRVLPGVDWEALRDRVSDQPMVYPERMFLSRVLSADLFFGSQ